MVKKLRWLQFILLSNSVWVPAKKCDHRYSGSLRWQSGSKQVQKSTRNLIMQCNRYEARITSGVKAINWKEIEGVRIALFSAVLTEISTFVALEGKFISIMDI